MAAKQRREDEHDRDMVLAYTIEVLHRQKKLPKVDTLMSQSTPSPRVSPAAHKVALMALAEHYGLKLRTTPRG